MINSRKNTNSMYMILLNILTQFQFFPALKYAACDEKMMTPHTVWGLPSHDTSVIAFYFSGSRYQHILTMKQRILILDSDVLLMSRTHKSLTNLKWMDIWTIFLDLSHIITKFSNKESIILNE